MDGGEQVAVQASGLKLLQVVLAAYAAGEGDRGDAEGLSGQDIGFGVANHPGILGAVAVPREMGDRFFQ